jgi:hypothetical protein
LYQLLNFAAALHHAIAVFISKESRLFLQRVASYQSRPLCELQTDCAAF